MQSTGFPLGMFPRASWEVDEISMSAGSMLLLYTDGVVERENSSGQLYGEQRLFEHAIEQFGSPVQAALAALLDDSDSFAASTPMSDDSTILLATLDSSRILVLNAPEPRRQTGARAAGYNVA